MIYETVAENGTTYYQASSRQVWLPGLYADRKAANYAFKCHPNTVDDLDNMMADSGRYAKGGYITLEMLKEAEAKRANKEVLANGD